MKRKLFLFVFISLFILMSLSGCVPGDGSYTLSSPAGFFSGIWHGWLAPLTLILHFFDRGVRLYEPNNIGWWYDFGFYMAIISGFGGLSLFRRKSKD